MNIDDKYSQMFKEAEAHPEYWLSIPATEFVEDVARRMREQGVSRSELARRLGTTRPYVTKLLRGDANFKLVTMVKVAMALRGVLHTHIADRSAMPRWLGVVVKNTARGAATTISEPPVQAVGARRPAIGAVLRHVEGKANNESFALA